MESVYERKPDIVNIPCVQNMKMILQEVLQSRMLILLGESSASVPRKVSVDNLLQRPQLLRIVMYKLHDSGYPTFRIYYRLIISL